MIGSTVVAGPATGCCTSCATVRDSRQNEQRQLARSLIVQHREKENSCLSLHLHASPIGQTDRSTTLWDRRHRRHQSTSESSAKPGTGPANAVIHHRPIQGQQEKQAPLDTTYIRDATLIPQCIERQQEREEHRRTFLSFSLRRRSTKAPPEYDCSSNKRPSTKQRLLWAMGQRFGRQQSTLPDIPTSLDEVEMDSKAVGPPGNGQTGTIPSLLLVGGVHRAGLSAPHQISPNMNEYAAGCEWLACAPLNGSNEHYYHQYFSQQPYATIVRDRTTRLAGSAGNKTHISAGWLERQRQMRNFAIGDRLANIYDEHNARGDRGISPCRQMVNACANFGLSPMAERKKWAMLPATPRLVKSTSVRQQTSSPLASTPLVQKRIQQTNGGYFTGIDYQPVPVLHSTSSSSPSPLTVRNGTLPSRSSGADGCALAGSGGVNVNDVNGLEPPPPTPEEAEDCLAAHLRVIRHESPCQRNRKQENNNENWPSPLLNIRKRDECAAKRLGSTDVLLDSRYQSQQSVGVMPFNRRSNSRPGSSTPQASTHLVHCVQHPHPHSSSSALRQSQESLMSLMSTSTTSMVVTSGIGRLQQPQQQQRGGGSSVGSQSPSVLIRGPCRHSHHYGMRHRAGPSSSCGSSSQGSSECGFSVNGARRHMYRRSARNLNVRIPSVETRSPVAEQKTGAPTAASILLDELKPAPFEVPCVDAMGDSSTIFVGRDWIFHELYEILVKSTSPEYGMKGAVVYGGVGTGKTAVVHQLASNSPFLVDSLEENGYDHQDSPIGSPHLANGSPCSDRVLHRVSVANSNGGVQGKNRTSNSTDSGFVSGSKLSLNNKHSAPAIPARHFQLQPPPRPPLPDWHRSVCQAVVAFHFCQIEHQSTCILPDFLRNLASMFACSPQLIAYRQFLLEQPKLLQLLTLEELTKNPLRSFQLAVTEPLTHLKKCGKLNPGNYLILIDGLDEAEFHRPEFGDSIGSFLVKYAMAIFPDWLKLVLTIKTAAVDLLKGMALHKICLDDTVIDEWVFKDCKEYIRLRISQSSTIQTNINSTKAPTNDASSPSMLGSSVGLNSDSTSSCPLARFAAHLASASKGNFLYMKLTLNLIEKNYLVMKGANYKVLPINLSEVFLLMFNLRFPTARAFERVAPVLNTVLASLKPLNNQELYETMQAGMINEYLTQEEFQERLKILGDYLVEKQDGTLVLFHPAFRDWLIRREDGQSPKYLCDMRYGHALLALRLSRLGHRLNSEEMQEMGHHLLKAHIFKRSPPTKTTVAEESSASAVAALFGRDCQLHWLSQVASDLRNSLCTIRNACYPNSKVSRLLLLAGASADAIVINFPLDDLPDGSTGNRDQLTPTRKTAPSADTLGTPLLCAAAFYGQQEFASLLLEFGGDIGVTETYKGRSALMLAAAQGHLDMVQLLHQHGAKLSQIDNEQRCALVHAAENGHAHVVSFLLQCDWNELAENQSTLGNGKTNMASSTYGYALRQQAAQQAFVAAASSGRTSVCEFLLDFGDVLVDEADPVTGETALSAACASARKETVGYLLNRAGARAAYGRQSEKPTPPLLQAVANGCWEIVSTLLARQMDVDGERNGMGQTALMVAAQFGHIAVLELLLSRNVNVCAVDDDGRTPLHWACLKDQPAAASLLLERGGSLQTFDKHGFGPIHYAAQHGSKPLIQFLLDRCPQLLETPTNSSSRLRPLDLAILAENVEAVQRCLKKGAKLAPSTWTFARDKPSMVAALLNKLLEDGQLLYKRNRLEDAQHRFTYALKKMPTPPSSSDSSWSEYSSEFDRLKFQLLLNYARCLRKNGDSEKAAETCTDAIRGYQQTAILATTHRQSHLVEEALVEAYICRARCFCELRQFEKAVEDLRRALRMAPTNRDAQQLLPKVKMALENDGAGKAQKLDNKDELNYVPTPPTSSRESSVPAIAHAETETRETTPAAAVSPNRSQASSDSGNMPDLDDGNKRKMDEVEVRAKRGTGLETQL